MKIFVVDDSAVTRGILEQELARIPGAELCGMAFSPEEAITAIRDLRPDIVILDIVLKGGNGFEVMRRLKELETLAVPVLVGSSRKSMIGNVLELPFNERIEGTAATVTLAIANGADVVRVHDVKEMSRVIRMTDAMVRA